MAALRTLWRALPLSPERRARLRERLQGAFSAAARMRSGTRGRAAPGPLIVAGFFGSVSGIGEGAHRFASRLEAAGFTVTRFDLAPVFGHARNLDAGAAAEALAPGGVLVLHLNGAETIQLAALRPDLFRGRRVIGYWAWETETLPAGWRPAFDFVDEVWAPSAFVADAVRAAAPRPLPVRVAPHPLEFGPAPAADRAAFGLPADAVVFLTTFDLRSTLARKNPAGAVEAFRRATERADGRAVLVCKVVGEEAAPAGWPALKAEIARTPGARLETRALGHAEMDRLVASCDAVLSLHRAEGFGLLPARAMAYGIPVVATGWSGNLEYMDADGALLVEHRLVPVEDPQGLYVGGRWAEPDLDDAADKIARLIDDPALRRRIGEAGRRAVERRLSAEAWAAEVVPALSPWVDARSRPGDAPADPG